MDDLLKNFAVYAVTVGYDSPIGNGNNYCLASPGGDTEAERAYRVLQYDHNSLALGAPIDYLCAPVAAAEQSIGVSPVLPVRRFRIK